MPGMDGLSLIERGRPMSPHTTFIVMTAFATIDTAVKAIKLGAESYLTKPLELDAVMAIVDRALDRTRLSREAAQLRERFDERFQLGNILGEHPSMQRLMKNIAQVARSRATVLIHGETGTGKELIAAAIHQNSKRKDKPFVKLNCASLSETLLESELFGHERGSFTGAMARREGRFKQADGGTLFLDEVSEIPASVQIKLLRFLQEREFERVGGNETLKVDVRVVAATNRNLKQRVDEGQLPRRPLLQAQGSPARRAATPGSTKRHSIAGPCVPAQVCRGERPPGPGSLRRSAAAPDDLPLARQRSRARKRDRTGRGHVRRRADRTRRLCPPLPTGTCRTVR